MTLADLFTHYQVASTCYDELLETPSNPRSHYQALYDFILTLPPEEFERRKQVTDLAFLHQGITFSSRGSFVGGPIYCVHLPHAGS